MALRISEIVHTGKGVWRQNVSKACGLCVCLRNPLLQEQFLPSLAVSAVGRMSFPLWCPPTSIGSSFQLWEPWIAPLKASHVLDL
jgi:hypothetical protein